MEEVIGKQERQETDSIRKESSDVKGIEVVDDDRTSLEDELDPVGLQRAFRFAAWASVGLVSRILLESESIIDLV